MNIDLSHHHALVCGSSQGIGASIAKAYALAGASVTLVARNTQKLKQVSAEISGTCFMLTADLSLAADLKRLERYIAEQGVDILVNNTGGPAPGAITTVHPEDFLGAFNAHLIASHRLSLAALPYMRERGFGRIINIISTSVKVPIPGLGVSNTTRGAMASWAKTLAGEVAAFGVTVNNVLPGFTETDRLQALIEKRAKEEGISAEQKALDLQADIPARRFGKPEEVAAFATFLASQYAAYVNGTSIPVDGGSTPSL